MPFRKGLFCLISRVKDKSDAIQTKPCTVGKNRDMGTIQSEEILQEFDYNPNEFF